MSLLPLHPQPVATKISRQKSAGFSTVEVIISLLVSLSFAGIAIQSIVAAAAIRVRAQEASDAANWVETDLSDVLNQARTLAPAANTVVAICNAPAGSAGFAAQLQTVVGQDTQAFISPIGERNYTLFRDTQPAGDNPHVLQVEYEVYRGTDIDNDPLIYSYYTEVIPDVTFTCR